VCSTAASAQSAYGESPGAALRRQLIELAANPSSVVELVETGRAALAVGDGQAALGFFMRAGQLSPRDYRVKAGLAAAHARTGRPETALVLFSEAASLGASEGELAAERGLAYDLLGQTARAQQDYTLALRHREDAEVRRRLALSLAISGQKDAALRLLDPQLRQADRAAIRARVMVLALTGDVTGATAAAKASMPLQTAQAITPFLTRLATLPPAQMASAANLGRLPGAGGMRSANARTGAAAADPGALAFAGGAPSLAHRLPVTPGASTAARRRPGVNESASASNVRARTPAPSAREPRRWTTASSTATVRPSKPESAPAATSGLVAASDGPSTLAAAAATSTALFLPHPHEPLPSQAKQSRAEVPAAAAAAAEETVELAGAAPPRIPVADAVMAIGGEAVLTGGSTSPTVAEPAAPAPAASAEVAPAAQALAAPAQAPADGAAANLAVWSTALPAAPSVAPAASTPRPSFSDIVAAVSALPAETAPAAAPEAKREKPAAGARPASNRPRQQSASLRTSTTARAAPARPAHPSRVWVQLAYSPNRNAFGYEISRMRKAAPNLLQGRTAHVAATGNRHRLLVGPFENGAAARTFINDLKKKEIDALAWTSPAGTEVARFAGK